MAVIIVKGKVSSLIGDRYGIWSRERESAGAVSSAPGLSTARDISGRLTWGQSTYFCSTCKKCFQTTKSLSNYWKEYISRIRIRLGLIIMLDSIEPCPIINTFDICPEGYRRFLKDSCCLKDTQLVFKVVNFNSGGRMNLIASSVVKKLVLFRGMINTAHQEARQRTNTSC